MLCSFMQRIDHRLDAWLLVQSTSSLESVIFHDAGEVEGVGEPGTTVGRRGRELVPEADGSWEQGARLEEGVKPPRVVVTEGVRGDRDHVRTWLRRLGAGHLKSGDGAVGSWEQGRAQLLEASEQRRGLCLRTKPGGKVGLFVIGSEAGRRPKQRWEPIKAGNGDNESKETGGYLGWLEVVTRGLDMKPRCWCWV